MNINSEYALLRKQQLKLKQKLYQKLKLLQQEELPLVQKVIKLKEDQYNHNLSKRLGQILNFHYF